MRADEEIAAARFDHEVDHVLDRHVVRNQPA